MKLSQILTLPLLTSGAVAIGLSSLVPTSLVPTSLVPAIRNTVSNANIPGVLAVAVEKSRELVTETLPQATVQGAKWVAANPGTAATCGVAGAGLVIVAAPAVAAAPALGAVGFGANGIVAGTTAAGMQSTIGSVMAPSLFATLQSAGAGGYGVATVYPVVQAVGGTIAASAGAGLAWVKSKA